MSAVRVIVADDYKNWRQEVRLLLQGRPDVQVISELADGIEVVGAAEKLKPDLILLDIELPGLNGIEAARQIALGSPGSKIVFLTQLNSPDIVQAALDTGALGYVWKMYAGRQLMPAIEAALRGERFLSDGIEVPELSSSLELKARHKAEFYSDDAGLQESFSRFIIAALRAGQAVIFVATKRHFSAVMDRLKAEGLDIDTQIARRMFIPLDVHKTLATFVVNGILGEDRFLNIAGELIEEAAASVNGDPSRVAACGEAAPVLWSQGKAHAAIRLEQLWDRLAKTYGISILCVYSLNTFDGLEGKRGLERVRAEHERITVRS